MQNYTEKEKKDAGEFVNKFLLTSYRRVNELNVLHEKCPTSMRTIIQILHMGVLRMCSTFIEIKLYCVNRSVSQFGMKKAKNYKL